LKVHSYRVGDIGPSGGYVFYDKGSSSDGWRYLEAAPEGWSGVAKDPKYVFGYYRRSYSESNLKVGTKTTMGTGASNTRNLVAVMGKITYRDPSDLEVTENYAALVCSQYTGNGKHDWFLPSTDELNMVFRNLKERGLGGFSSNYYWSSSEMDSLLAWYQGFNNGNRNYYTRDNLYMVRPIRAF
jgi:hypothetical protein